MAMNPKTNLQKGRLKFNDKSTSDVILRLTSDEGRNDLFHCHVSILTQKSHYFASLLSNNLSCLKVHCLEPEVNAYVSTLRLLYSPELDTWHSISHTLGILLAADRLGCHEITGACISHLEASPWDESEEDEILRSVSVLGSGYYQILSRIFPVDPIFVSEVCVSAFSFATSPQSTVLEGVKCSVREQLEYLLTEDDDSPIVPIKVGVNDLASGLFAQFDLALTVGQPPGIMSLISDVCWVSKMMSGTEMMREVVGYWVDRAEVVVAAAERMPNGPEQLEARMKVVEAVTSVLEAIGSGSAILPAKRRLRVVNAWLPFAQRTRCLFDFCSSDDLVTVDFEMWESLESAFVSTLLTLPSGDLAEVLTGWLRGEKVQYPDLTEAFEVWCYRTKVAKKRFGIDGGPFRGSI